MNVYKLVKNKMKLHLNAMNEFMISVCTFSNAHCALVQAKWLMFDYSIQIENKKETINKQDVIYERVSVANRQVINFNASNYTHSTLNS